MPWKRLLTDRQIVARVLSGRRDDFELLVRRHLPMAQAVAYAQLGPRSDAEDVIQEGFVRAYAALDKLEKPEQFRSWLAAIVRNLALSALRREARSSKVLPALAQTDAVQPHLEIERRDLHEMLETEIRALDEPHREVLLMHYFGGMKVREVAETLNVSKEVAAKRLQRGRQALSNRVLGALDSAGTQKPDTSPKVKAIMGLIAASPVVWRSAAASAGVAALLPPAILKVGLTSVVLLATVAAVLIYQRSSPSIPDDGTSMSGAVSERVPAPKPDEPAVALNTTPASNDDLSPPVAETRPTGVGVITGAVLGPNGDPLPNATLRAAVIELPDALGRRAHYEYATTTGTDGRFRIENLPLEWVSITGGVPGRLTGCQDVGLSEDFPEWFVWLETEEGASVAGRVVDRSDRPIAGTTVTPLLLNGDRLSRWDMQALATPVTTDAKGQFAFEWLLPGTWEFELVAPGFASTISESVPAGTTDAKIVISTGGSLTGTALVAATGQPVGGGTVQLYPAARFQPRSSADVEPDGAFTFNHLAPGAYDVRYADSSEADSGSGYYLAERPVVVEIVDGQITPTVELPLTPGAAVSGVITHADGAPCVDCGVVAHHENGNNTEAQTDHMGRYHIAGLVPGEYTVTAYPRYSASEQSVTLEAGKIRSGIDFQYPKGAANITGTVTDDAGNPLPDVEVTALDQYWDRSSAQATSGEDGTFRITGVPSTDMLWIRPNKAGWVGQDVMTRLTDRGIDGVSLTMTQPATILGRVVDSSGLPAEDVTVWYRGVDISVFTAVSSRTTKGGRFAFAGLVPGEYRLLVEQDGAPEVELGRVHVGPGEVVEDVTLVLADSSGLELAGTVVNASGNRVSGAILNIYAQGESGMGIDAKTDRFGRFTFHGLEKEKYRLIARAYGYGATEMEDIEAGQHDLQVQLLVTGSVEGRVLAKGSGDPVPMFYVAVMDGERNRLGDDDTRLATQFTNESGTYSATGINAGTHTVAAWAEGYAPAFQVVDIVPGQSVSNIVLWLEPDMPTKPEAEVTTTVSGMVVDDAGRPIADAALFLDDLPSGHEQLGLTVARTGADGRFVIEEVPADTDLIVAKHDAYGPGGVALAGSTTDLTIVLPSAGTVEGTIRENGTPVTDEFLVVQFQAQGYTIDETAHTDAIGAYTVTGIPEGPATVLFWRSQFGSDRKYVCEVDVQAGQTSQADFDLVTGSSEVTGLLLVDGEPVRGWVGVEITTPGGAVNAFTAFVHESGAFHLPKLPAGTVRLDGTAELDGVAYAGQEVVVVGEGEAASVELALTPSAE